MFPRDIQLTDFVYNPVTRLSLSPSLSFSAVFCVLLFAVFQRRCLVMEVLGARIWRGIAT